MTRNVLPVAVEAASIGQRSSRPGSSSWLAHQDDSGTARPPLLAEHGSIRAPEQRRAAPTRAVPGASSAPTPGSARPPDVPRFTRPQAMSHSSRGNHKPNARSSAVPGAGLEPARVATGDFKSPASAIPPPRQCRQCRQHRLNESARPLAAASADLDARGRYRRFGSCCRRGQPWARAPSPLRHSSLRRSR